MAHHLVIGAGGIGRATARHLVERGHQVTLASRSGTNPHLDGVRAASVDASDPAALTDLAQGVESLVNAVNPSKYYTWERDWPPVAAAMLTAAEKSGAGLVTVSNLYGYGHVDAPMTEDTALRPTGMKGRLRAEMWQQALQAHEAGRLRATELRASDYFGPGAGGGVSLLNSFVIKRAIAGRGVWLITGAPDVPHSWTYLDDIGVLAATLATDDRSWGSAWHVPTAAPRTMREVAKEAAAIAGRPEPAVRGVPHPVKLLARVSATVRELDETAYQFERPFVLDATRTAETFGLTATDWDQALAETVSWLAGGGAS